MENRFFGFILNAGLHARNVSEAFINFLKNYRLINFSFIVNDRKKLFGKNHEQVKQFWLLTFMFMRDQYQQWLKSQPSNIITKGSSKRSIA
ncbi:MAG: hypothetical protein JNK79_01770 [Chitinophagaceae bacterium]|nr:hypothetical protein [Chitinophagaceae bacterium]